MYAVIQTGGKQYKVAKNQVIRVEKLAGNAGDMISEITLAMKAKLGLKTIGSAIHPYPTQAEAIRRIGDLYNRTRLTPFVKSLFKKWLAWGL